jgi:hypothetical protein
MCQKFENDIKNQTKQTLKNKNITRRALNAFSNQAGKVTRNDT